MNPWIAYVNDSDLRVSWRLRRWSPPRWLRAWMIAATRLGDGWLWLGVAAGLLLLGEEYHRVLAAGATAAALASAGFATLKRRIRRRRPCEIAPHPLFRSFTPPDRFSFPSGHTMNACAIATVLGLRFPQLAPLLFVAAASIGASRVVLGLHYVSDVLAGAVLGGLIGTAVFRLFLA